MSPSSLSSQVAALERELSALREQKDVAYNERDRCVALIARMAVALGFRAGLGQHDPADTSWDADWRTIVFIDLPAGQVSWHIADHERPLFDFLPAYPGAWDGHSTEEKYRRVVATLHSATPAQSSGAVVPEEVAATQWYAVYVGDSMTPVAMFEYPDEGQRWAEKNYRSAVTRVVATNWPQVPAAGEVEKLRHQRDVARACVNTDMTHLARALVEVVKRARGFTWIADGESGSHTYDEDERAWLREEIGHALEQIIGVATDALRMSGNIAYVAFEDPLFPKPSAPAAGEVERLREDLRRVADAMGYVNYGEGTGGYEIAPIDVLVDRARKQAAAHHEAEEWADACSQATGEAQEAEDLCNAILAAGLAECERLREEVAELSAITAADEVRAAVEAAVEAARREEREACAKWLRFAYHRDGGRVPPMLDLAARDLERGEHAKVAHEARGASEGKTLGDERAVSPPANPSATSRGADGPKSPAPTPQEPGTTPAACPSVLAGLQHDIKCELPAGHGGDHRNSRVGSSGTTWYAPAAAPEAEGDGVDQRVEAFIRTYSPTLQLGDPTSALRSLVRAERERARASGWNEAIEEAAKAAVGMKLDEPEPSETDVMKSFANGWNDACRRIARDVRALGGKGVGRG